MVAPSNRPTITSSSGSHSVQAMTGLACRSGNAVGAPAGLVASDGASEGFATPLGRSLYSMRSMNSLIRLGKGSGEFRRLRRAEAQRVTTPPAEAGGFSEQL